jgi:hypothetical protein
VKRIPGLLLSWVIVAGIAAEGSPHRDSGSVIVRVSDAQISLELTAGPSNINNCLIVYANGRMHLELRRQEFFTGNADYGTYEGVISTGELAALHSILDRPGVERLPPFRSPKLPLASSNFGWFSADIYREGTVQEVGYPFWEGGPSPSEDEKSAWEEQRAALEPLVHWSRAIKYNRSGWRKVRNRHSVCQP